MKTPKNKKSPAAAVQHKNSSEKKLVQARLPFKILSTPSTVTGASSEGVAIAKDSSEARKRKLSYDEEDSEKTPTTKQSPKRRSMKKGKNEANVKKRKEIINVSASKKEVIANVVLSDSDGDDDSGDNDISISKENVEKATKRNPPTKVGESSDVLSDDADLIESSDEDKGGPVEKGTPKSANNNNNKSINEVLIKTPASSKKSTPKNKNSATPKSNKKGRKSAGETGSATKLKIKLPISSKKNKRRKQANKVNDTTADEQDFNDELSDDVEIISKELHPEKRPKLDVAVDDDEKRFAEETKSNDTIDNKELEKENEIEEIIEQSSVVEEESTENVEKNKDQIGDKNENSETNKDSPATSTNADEVKERKSDFESENEKNTFKIQEISSDTLGSEADTETTVNSTAKETATEQNEKLECENKNAVTPKISNELSVHKIQKKSLTPKQQKLMERRLQAREEKERKIQEERMQKQREKEERELVKKREREEKEDQRRKEREEKEDQRRKEREEKERKRLAEIEAKNEEKRKRTEAKEEEQRKKEEERKRKEQEKEEAEQKKKKAALAFTKFFSRPSQELGSQRPAEEDVAEENPDLLAFRPFQIKGDMKLAPIVRKKLSEEERHQMETCVEGENSTKSYLEELKSGAIKPYKWSPPAQDENETAVSRQEADEDDDDVMIIEDELERAGQAIVEEHCTQIERHRVKFYKFAENRRPPYFGTWRKKSKIVTPRRPFAQDKQFFDYEVDSDDEWEEEEPGESLDGSDDDKEKESEDDDYEVDNEWFVPHGHLSEEEMQNEDDLGENNDREAQKAKLQVLQREFAQEMKKKTEKIKPRLIGCIWVDENGNQPELCPKIIWDTLNMRAILCAEPPLMEEIKSNSDEMNINANVQNAEKGGNGEAKLKPITLTESMLKQLVKLIHGNIHSKAFLIKEFIAYIEANEESVRNGEFSTPLKSAVREKIEEFAQWQVIEKVSSNNESTKSAKVQKIKKKLCWIVSKDILQKMNMDTIGLHNNWSYTLQPRIRPKLDKKETASNKIVSNEEGPTESSATSDNATDPTKHTNNKPKQNSNIIKFTKVLTVEEKAQQLQKKVDLLKTQSSKETALTSSAIAAKPSPKSNSANKQSNGNQTPVLKKRVPLLMSVARGEKISTPVKNARISEFLKNINETKQQEKEKNEDASTTPMDTNDIVVLD